MLRFDCFENYRVTKYTIQDDAPKRFRGNLNSWLRNNFFAANNGVFSHFILCLFRKAQNFIKLQNDLKWRAIKVSAYSAKYHDRWLSSRFIIRLTVNVKFKTSRGRSFWLSLFDDTGNFQIDAAFTNDFYQTLCDFSDRFILNIFLFLISDRRAKQFPLMDTPIPTGFFIFVYLAWVVVIGPLYMRDRKPFKLNNTLIYYNAFQVLLSGYMFYEVKKVAHWSLDLHRLNF